MRLQAAAVMLALVAWAGGALPLRAEPVSLVQAGLLQAAPGQVGPGQAGQDFPGSFGAFGAVPARAGAGLMGAQLRPMLAPPVQPMLARARAPVPPVPMGAAVTGGVRNPGGAAVSVLASAQVSPLASAVISPVKSGGNTSASLFVGRQAGGLFALVLRRAAPAMSGPQDPAVAAPDDSGLARDQVARIRALIGWAEAGAMGYDAVQWGARIKPPKPPTEMTLGEIFAWIEATPGQPHAIGFYQFIPPTLARLVTRLDLGPDAVFSPALQDRLGDILLAEAGLQALRAGRIDRITFMNNLAKIWAGLPNSSGKSHYQGVAGNAASITWAAFEQEMLRIFPG